MSRLGYAAMLAFCLVGTLPLIRVYRLRLRWRPVVLAVLAGGVPFLVWDIAATAAGQWAFDPAQTLSVRVCGLPLEELGFFVVVPLAAILTYESVRVVLAEGSVWPRRTRRFREGSQRPGPSGALE